MQPDQSQPLTDVFVDLFAAWANGRGPADAIEGAYPELAAAFACTAEEFTFDRFIHANPEAGWSWVALSFPEVVEGSFHVYCPDSWSEHVQRGPMATLATAHQVIRQSCMLTTLQPWASSVPQWAQRNGLLGFDYRPQAPGFSRWLLVTKAEDAYWCWGIYQAGDSVFIAKGDAADAAGLNELLQALSTSEPWYEWLPRAD